MTSKERVKAAINWKTPDRIPLHEDFWTDTPQVWIEEGFPENITIYPPALNDHKHISIDEHFDFDIALMYLDCSPRYEQKILSHKGEYYTYEDRYGYTAEKPWQKSGSIHYVSVKTTDREAWDRDKDKWKLSNDPEEPARIDDSNYFEHFNDYPSWSDARKKYDVMQNNERYILFKNYGPWEATWRHRDFSNLLMDIALEPDWVTEMGRTHLKLTIEVLQKCIDDGMKPDGYFMVDDLGGSNGPLMSPDMWRSVYKETVKELGDFLKKHDIDFWMHSCGNAELIYDDLIECGVKVMNPLQVSAELDIRNLKDKYKDRLAFYGNIDAHILDGDWVTLEHELISRKKAFSEGGWICHTDHSIPPTMSLQQFEKMVEIIRR
jgi:uroporphyrinogen decarboxylase